MIIHVRMTEEVEEERNRNANTAQRALYALIQSPLQRIPNPKITPGETSNYLFD